jgi:hypothetical protein
MQKETKTAVTTSAPKDIWITAKIKNLHPQGIPDVSEVVSGRSRREHAGCFQRFRISGE